MKLTPLTLEHALPLLHFELENRDWFEQSIEPREQDFYSLTGVQTHIAEMLLDKSLNKGLTLLITDTNEQIIGRINLHNITCGKAFLGYRLSARHTGQGITKSAIIKLLPMARELGIKRLVAMVSTENIASKKSH
ncbi:acetyltransferase [Vibrio ponticus]|nr:acetyltransferase [Vibrio ponticus]